MTSRKSFAILIFYNFVNNNWLLEASRKFISVQYTKAFQSMVIDVQRSNSWGSVLPMFEGMQATIE